MEWYDPESGEKPKIGQFRYFNGSIWRYDKDGWGAGRPGWLRIPSLDEAMEDDNRWTSTKKSAL